MTDAIDQPFLLAWSPTDGIWHVRKRISGEGYSASRNFAIDVGNTLCGQTWSHNHSADEESTDLNCAECLRLLGKHSMESKRYWTEHFTTREPRGPAPEVLTSDEYEIIGAHRYKGDTRKRLVESERAARDCPRQWSSKGYNVKVEHHGRSILTLQGRD